MRILAAIHLFATMLMAGPTATLTGRVTDPSGAAIAKVEVQAINVETGAKAPTETNDEGLYRIPSLPPGMYRLVLQKHGFKMFIKTGIELHVQDIAALNFEMQIGSVSESVTVEEGAPLIQAETATVEQVIDRNLIAELPTLTRNPYDFVGLSAGAVAAINHSGDVGVNYAINGQRPESAAFLLDGSDNVNPDTSTPAVLLPSDAIREYRVMTNGFSAEYGRNSGFVANLVSKSGTNEFHGSAYDYVRNSWFAANSFENNANRFPRAVFNRHQPGGTLGGPVVRDKAFFFVSYESLLVRSSDTRLYSVPSPELLSISAPAMQALFQKYPVRGTPTGLPPVMRTVKPFGGASAVTIPAFNQVALTGPADAGADPPQDDYLANARLDYTLSSRNTLSASWSYQGRTLFPTRQPYGAKLELQNLVAKQTGNIVLTRIWSTRLVTESRVVVKRLTAYHDEAGPDGLFSAARINAEVAVLPTGSPRQGNWLNTIQLSQSVNWVAGKHSVKIGGSVLPQRDNQDLSTSGVTLTFSNVQGFVLGIATVNAALDFFANHVAPGDPVRGPLAPPVLRRHVRFADLNWYLQDTWKLSRRLTLTPGIRWEYFGVGHSAGAENALNVNFYPGSGANFFEQFANGGVYPLTDAPGKYRGHNLMPDRNNFAPRIGLAYDLTGDGKTVLRAGGGLFYDNWFGGHVAPFYGSVSFSNATLTTDMLASPYNVSAQAAAVKPTFGTLDPDRRTPYSVSWNASVQREVSGAAVLSATYVGSSGVSLYEISRYNAPGSGRYIGLPDQPLQPKFSFIQITQNLSHSSFHGLQLKAESRALRSSGLQFGVNYSWGHSIDNASSSSGETIGFQQCCLTDPFQPRLDRGNSSFDQRQRVVGYFIWKIPALRQGPSALRSIANGWQTSGVLSLQTGQPFHLEDLGVADRAPVATRPRVTGVLPQVLDAAHMITDPVTPNRWLYLPVNRTRNGSACLPNPQPFGCYETIYDPMNDVLPRSIFRRPGSVSQDVALSRTLRVNERFSLQLRGEFYNLVNHTNLVLAGGQGTQGFDVNNPLFAGNTQPGVVARYGGTPRQVVVAAKILF